MALQHIQKRSGIYYFRIAVPAHLLAKMYRKEIKVSLRTNSHPRAKSKLCVMMQKSQQLFDEIEGMDLITKEQADLMIKHYLRDQIDAFGVDAQNFSSFAVFPMRINRTKDHVTKYKLDKSNFDFLSDENIESFIDASELKQKIGIHLKGAERNFSDVYREYMKDHGVQYPEGTIPHTAIMMALRHSLSHLREYEGNTNIKTLNEVKILPLSNIEQEDKKELSCYFSEYLQEEKKTGTRDSTIRKKTEAFSLFVEIIGDLPINNIQKKEAQKFKKILMSFPSNRNKKQIYKNIPINDFLGMDIPDSDKIAINTINGHLTNIQSFFNWAESNGYYTNDKNIFNGLKLKNKSKSLDLRKPFNQEELKKIFSCPIYQGCFRDNQTGWYKNGDLIIKDSPRYWLPLIALYSGARQGEIYHLNTEDIKIDNGIYYFDFVENVDEGKLLKTKASRRKIPIHSKILDAGFIEYIKGRGGNDHKKLFTQPDQRSYSKQFANLLKRLSIKHDKNAFHSFRHCMKDALDHAGVSDRINHLILGHSDNSVHGAYGSGTIPMVQLKEAIEKVKYDFINLP